MLFSTTWDLIYRLYRNQFGNILAGLLLLLCGHWTSNGGSGLATLGSPKTALQYHLKFTELGNQLLYFVRGWSCDGRYWRSGAGIFKKSSCCRS